MKFNFLVLACLVVALLSSCQKEQLKTEEHQGTDLSLSEIESASLLAKAAKTTANANESTLITLSLENGNKLEFFELETADTDDFLVLESHDCTDCSALATIASKMGEDNYTAHDIFWAFSKPGTPVPDKLVAQQKTLNITSQLQGWALTKMEAEASSRGNGIACNNNSFRNSIAGGFLSGPTWIGYDKTPNRYSSFYEDCLDPFNNGRCVGDRYQYNATYHNAKRWAGKICAKSVQASYNDHNIKWCGGSCSIDPSCSNRYYCETYIGPTISFQYLENGSWYTYKNGNKVASYEIAANRTQVQSWWLRADQPTSFRLKVENAKGYDEFDFMMDAE